MPVNLPRSPVLQLLLREEPAYAVTSSDARAHEPPVHRVLPSRLKARAVMPSPGVMTALRAWWLAAVLRGRM